MNGRTSLYIGAVSAALIALAFVGQLSRVGTAFYVFSFVLFPSLIFMGFVTFERVIESTYAVITYARGIHRLRHLYLEYAPQVAPYFLMPTSDDIQSVTGSVGIRPSWWQLFLITPGMIAVLNSVLVGALVGLSLSYFFGWSLVACAGCGVVAFLVSVGLQQRHHWRHSRRVEQSIPARFPHEAAL